MDEVVVGIVVPTMGTRPEYLDQCLRSIRGAGAALIHIVIPADAKLHHEISPDLYDQIISDPKQGLAFAIHTGLSSFPENVKYVNWLGDDDLLKPNSLTLTSNALNKDKDAVLVYGGCEYIDSNNETLFINTSSKFAVPLMFIGPQLIPQPGALFRLSSYKQINGLDYGYKWAFDLDLLIRLSKIGTLKFLDSTVASFRWHESSLSVGGRDGSVREASNIRIKCWPRQLRIIAKMWEIPMRSVIKYAGTRVSRRGAARKR